MKSDIKRLVKRSAAGFFGGLDGFWKQHIGVF